MKKRYLFAFSLLCFNVHAVEMYQWIDEDGSMRVSETPPPEGIEYSTMEIDDSVPFSSEPAPAPESNTDEEAKEETEVERAQRILKEENCRISQNNMQELRREGNLLVKDENNPDKYIEVTDEMRAQKIVQTQADIDKYCKKEGDESSGVEENTFEENPDTFNESNVETQIENQ